MNAPAFFRDKASTLAELEGQLRTARVLPQVTLAHGDWRAAPEHALAAILARSWARTRPGATGQERPALIVRSSAAGEDGATWSLAGHYVSVPDVVGEDALAVAIDTVFASYAAPIADDQKVLIQPMLQDVVASGVATSREVGSGRPYIVVNTSLSPDTSAVTAGRSNDTEVCYHFRGALTEPAGRCGAIVRLLREIEDLTGLTRIDIEFAFVAGQHEPVLLQARPLVNSPPTALPRDRHCRDLKLAEDKIGALLGERSMARGHRSALGVMPDWNPAEMIGVRPRPLALSLYRDLVTDDVWARQRNAYGYRDLRGTPLLIDLLGIPFIDVRASFESFVPAALDDDAAERLVDHYMARLLAAPNLHDKIEFEIVLSCYAFDTDAKLAQLAQAGFAAGEIERLGRALHTLTRQVMDPRTSPRLLDRGSLERLQARRRQLAAEPSPLVRAYWLLEDCRRFGTRPFAGLARVGFIAVQLLNSLVSVGAISDEDRQAFMMSVSTVASEMQRDLARLSRNDFLERYGHLRPGAYDILSPRYDETPDFYFGKVWTRRPDINPQSDDIPLEARSFAADTSIDERHTRARVRLEAAAAPLLAAHGFELSAGAFFDFLAEGVREREHAKFLFTRNLSDALVALGEWGESVGLDREALSFADIGAIRVAHGSARDPLTLFSETIRQGRERHQVTQATCLPPLIVAPQDVWNFHLPMATPNFVTARAAQGRVVRELDETDLTDAIVLIPNADPGYDWIFSRRIAGLITAYGGANSHMAIRSAELDLPAVIGAGEHLFSEWAQAGGLRIDCAGRRVEILPMGASC
ncbi:PEP/pyruvate-binding domain-containing protein [Caulobacter sp. RL271]|uniref:PEP-utilizing enzyme n=1 Tax=Caulobacter segnis TaxID=88688 RepID=A0ABY4ZSD0_9CAUL|nr:PEP/pyruvate-binding domain-containing protein [Caulobacter segnis]USQ95289.1 PEP-utilizing enzyme [Caulobacter segnis]